MALTIALIPFRKDPAVEETTSLCTPSSSVRKDSSWSEKLVHSVVNIDVGRLMTPQPPTNGKLAKRQVIFDNVRHVVLAEHATLMRPSASMVSREDTLLLSLGQAEAARTGLTSHVFVRGAAACPANPSRRR